MTNEKKSEMLIVRCKMSCYELHTYSKTQWYCRIFPIYPKVLCEGLHDDIIKCPFWSGISNKILSTDNISSE